MSTSYAWQDKKGGGTLINICDSGVRSAINVGIANAGRGLIAHCRDHQRARALYHAWERGVKENTNGLIRQ